MEANKDTGSKQGSKPEKQDEHKEGKKLSKIRYEEGNERRKQRNNQLNK